MTLKIAFHANNLSERGTAVALFDYARYNMDILGNNSIITYNSRNELNDTRVIERFKEKFEVIPCSNFSEAESEMQKESCDLVYVIKSGKRDELISDHIPTLVHAVFPTSIQEVHGSSYAFVSKWLSDTCSKGRVPWVPHAITVGQTEDNMRQQLKIPEDAIVFGGYGGRDSFDIDFFKNKVIPNILNDCPSVWFIFMNFDAFINHPRVIFLPGQVEIEAKTAFINTCNACLHARMRGETFGLAIGEFSLRGKPIITYGKSKETAHLDILGNTANIYNSPRDLYQIISKFDLSAQSAKEKFMSLCSPDSVMEKFNEHLIKPAIMQQHPGFNPFRDSRPKLGPISQLATRWLRIFERR